MAEENLILIRFHWQRKLSGDGNRDPAAITIDIDLRNVLPAACPDAHAENQTPAPSEAWMGCGRQRKKIPLAVRSPSIHYPLTRIMRLTRISTVWTVWT
ncbi:hypothetical protein JS528_00200 [Bifidobacterium sp. MA2]|uniref:Uncharacterized protein n=1 Tax=Bifidobacterium santillanense TaxID=2809028 RepID=A0ABS5ULW9_9BIFI|nr:hypothetical protein [Bifidobacterium santillanense]MBT1171805.1 hypothetical protein [Bifidobacterium santillanense]